MAVHAYINPEIARALGAVGAQHPEAGIELHWEDENSEQRWLITAEYYSHKFKYVVDDQTGELWPLATDEDPSPYLSGATPKEFA